MTDLPDNNAEQKDNLQMQLFSLTDTPSPSHYTFEQYSNSIIEIDQAPRFYRGQNRAIKITDIQDDKQVIRELKVVTYRKLEV